MATKKTEAVPVEKLTANVAEDLNEAPAAVDDPWLRNMEMVVPRKPKGEDQQYYICVNDRRFMVPANGKVQSLPEPIALVLQQSLEAENEADDFADHIPNRSGEQPNEHPL